MIILTKEQLADLLRESFALGAIARGGREQLWVATESFHDVRERAIQPLVHRSSGGHDDHGREVEAEPISSYQLAGKVSRYFVSAWNDPDGVGGWRHEVKLLGDLPDETDLFVGIVHKQGLKP